MLCEIYYFVLTRDCDLFYGFVFYSFDKITHTHMFMRYSHEERREIRDNRRMRGKGTKKRRESNERRKENIN